MMPASSHKFKERILVVDDDPGVLEISKILLERAGYEVVPARDGFEALAIMRTVLPDVLISDLRMPNMSGFELLSVVRRRFPQVPVIAVSGEFSSAMPTGLLADAFFEKGHYTPEDLFAEIARQLDGAPPRPPAPRGELAPIWVPRSHEDYFVITCTECLRSFSVHADLEPGKLETSDCPNCGTHVNFRVDPTELTARETLQRKARYISCK
jgi:CheY-like chemotaxis protein